MKLVDIDFIKLIPEFMRNDEAIIALAKVVNEFSRAIVPKLDALSTWSKIDDLTESELDELAWELNIDWYNKKSTLEVKKEIIKNSDLVHARRGTKWAVEQLVTSYFGSGKVKEWHEYGGDPYMFKVITSNPAVTQDLTQEFLKAVEKSKNVRSWLEAITIELGSNISILSGIGYHVVTKETHVVGGEVLI